MENTKRAVQRSQSKAMLGVLMIATAIGSRYWPAVEETRWYRDATLRTPFYAVEVNANHDGEQVLSLSGTFKKRRCDPTEPIEAIIRYIGNHDLDRVPVDTSADDGGRFHSKFPSNDTYGFGPWFARAPKNNPVRWEIWVTHMCPEGKTVNLFAEGAWP